ncbi:MAG TPA: M28 family metallopeptidase [Terriglobales bacterium]|nr:M28 family metallopeptidase [Terriglobales bacterium]
MLPRFIPIVSLISLSLASAAAQQLSRADQRTADAAMNSIRPDAIRAHMRFLSDSLLEGRGTGTRGHQIAAQYVATELEAIGVKPAGVNGTWFQSVPLRKITLATEQTSYEFVRDGKAQALREGEEFATSGDAVYTDTNVDAAVVFVGFGVTAPDQHYDDYAGVDVHGKLVAILYGAPARFPSTERAYYSDGVVKSRNAVAHGAIGVLAMMTPEDQKRYAWKWIVPQIRQGDMRWLDVKGVPADSFPELHAGGLLSQSGTDMLFAGAPKTFAQACADANASKSQAFPLAVTAKIHTVSRHERITAPNVIGVLRGSDPKLRDQYVVYTAHTDHLGICDPVEGDNVCHGALDNASGTAALLEIAHAFTTLPQPPRRSILFVFVTGEEMGLLGSDYYAHFPTVPAEQLAANVNIDGAPGLLFPLKDVVALGAEHSTLGGDVEVAARRMNLEISPDPMPEEVYFIRSDQYSFVRQGVPAVNITEGLKAADPKLDGAAIMKKWNTTIYHTPKDNMDQPLNFDSAAKSTRLNFLVGYEVAQQAQRPAWNVGDFFGAKFAKSRSSAAGGGQ